MLRTIFHMDLDVFFVAVERALNPELNGKPVIVSPGTARSVVSTASYEARKFGVHSAMPMAQARRLCPQAIVCPGNFKQYQAYSKIFFQVLEQYSPVIESASLDEGYLDYTGCESLFGSPLKAATTLQQQVKKQVGLDVSIGIASSKLVAKLASDLSKPAGILMILPGQEEAFLRPLAIRRLMGIGPKSEPRMKALGIHRIGDLLKVPGPLLARAFGNHGLVLQEMARGVDLSPVSIRGEAKSIGHEETFSEDSTSEEYVRHALHRLTCEVGYRMRKQGFKAQTVTVKIRYADFSLHTHEKKLSQASNVDRVLFETAKELLDKLLTRRVRVRLIGVSCKNLIKEPDQLSLISGCHHAAWERLHDAADKIKRRYGYDCLNWASLIKQEKV